MNDLLLLANLLDGPIHGYALKKQVGLIAGNPAMHNNLVYPVLRRFVAKGWVKQKKVPGQRGQTRVVYSLTSAGRAELLQRLGEFGPEEARSPDAFQLRVGLFEFLDETTRDNILAQRRDYLGQREKKLTNLQGQLEIGHYGNEVIRFLKQQARAELGWIANLDDRATQIFRRKRDEGKGLR